jgi:hypothetical protein
VALSFQAQAQSSKKRIQINNPGYDDKNFSYGFLLGVHTNAYKLKYSDQFVNSLDSVYAISPRYSNGFVLGFIINFKLQEFFDLRVTPTVAFYEHVVEYDYVDDPTLRELLETTSIELPILLKYKSERRGNTRMYLIGGVKPAFEASGKNEIETVGGDNLKTKSFNFSGEIGVGLDVYYPLFKFSPELRYSRGFVNMLEDGQNDYGIGIDRLTTNSISLIFFFQ